MIAPTSFFADYGCHVRVLEEVRALQARGHRVRICTYHNGDDLPGLDIHRSVDVPWLQRAEVGSSRHKAYLDVALFAETLRQALAFRPDLIHGHLHEGALIGSVVGRLLRKPVVFDYQGSLTEEMLDHGFIRQRGKRERFFRRLERVIDRLPELAGPAEPPARLHGDLWSGNVLADGDGRPWLVDPAAYGGHREIDLAMLALFGTPSARTLAAYDEVHPRADGHEARVPLWQLLPLLVHAVLFRGGYGVSAAAAARRAAP
jgi:hypothetical protein